MSRERERIRRRIFDKPEKKIQEVPQGGNNINVINPEVNPELLKMFPPERIKRLMEKEARKYKASLEKKWRKYLEAVNR